MSRMETEDQTDEDFSSVNEFSKSYIRRFSYLGHSWNGKPYINYKECPDNILEKGEVILYE